MKKYKFLKDIYYKDTFEIYGKESLKEAGWFDDKLKSINYNERILTTSLSKIIKNIGKTKKPLAVLLTTGGFAPLHDGHIDMMELSKNRLEKEGYKVVGGYFSTSHDKYVLNKYEGSIKLTALERIEQIDSKIKDSNWLMSDPWESLYVPSAINFTDVIIRLEKYIKYHLKINVKIFYVFGSDNYNFHKAFVKKGYCCIVERYNSVIKDPKVSNRIFYIKNNKKTAELSSSNLRSKELNKKKSVLPYLIRDDAAHFSKEDLKSIKESLIKVFKKYKKAIYIPVKDQQLIMDNIKGPVLSLDKITKSSNKINVSRLFNVSDIQSKPETLVISNKKIKKKKYVIVDDDIASGYTIEQVKRKLKIKGIKEVSLSEVWYKSKFNKEYQIDDIVDLRDFIFGVKDGGLLVKLPSGKKGRVPYIYPFVNLNTRAKINYKDFLSFTKKILEINLDYYQNKGVKVKHLEKYFVNFILEQGYSENESIVKIIKEWIKLLV